MLWFSERKKQPTPVKELVEKRDEEEWALKDVVFVEDAKTLPVGKVVKVDGAYAAVKFPGKGESADLYLSSSNKEDLTSLLQDCRLLRKDDLMVVKGMTAPKLPDCFQKTPKKVCVPESGQIITVCVDNEGA